MTDADKADRLAAALRENLRKRKAQARSLSEQTDRKGNCDKGAEG